METPQKLPWDGELVPGILEAQILYTGRCFIINFGVKAESHPSHAFRPNKYDGIHPSNVQHYEKWLCWGASCPILDQKRLTKETMKQLLHNFNIDPYKSLWVFVEPYGAWAQAHCHRQLWAETGGMSLDLCGPFPCESMGIFIMILVRIFIRISFW